MGVVLYSAVQSLILVAALSTDAFVASFAYGTNKIKIPFLSVAIISVISTLVLTVSLFLGSLIGPSIPQHLTKIVCFLILLALGIAKLFDSSIKSFIKKHSSLNKEIKFSMFNLKFILNIYANPEKADRDYSRVLSPYEAASLALAVSLDGLAAGFGWGLVHINKLEVIIISLLFGMLAVILGSRIGNRIADKLSLNITWLSGALLLVLAILKL